jgi:hypothetical protein
MPVKDLLRRIAFALGCGCVSISIGLLVIAYIERNPYSESDAKPFSIPVKLDGSESRTEFTAATKEIYELRVNIFLPAEAKEKWVRYSCLMGSEPMYYTCQETGHLKSSWTIRDMTDANWHGWEVNSHQQFEVTDGIGSGVIGWFTPVPDHHYVVIFKADADVPQVRQSRADLYSYFGNESTQLTAGFGNLATVIWLMLAIPFAAVGLPLVLIFRPRRKP